MEDISGWSANAPRADNDLKADLDGEMRRIADFLDIAIPENLWPGLVQAADFESMKHSVDELMPKASNI